MNEKLIKKIIRDALELDDSKITNIERTPGGITNKSYFATVNNQEIVVRIPGSGTEELVNRKEEKDNLLYATRLGINPPLLYFNIDNGFKITQKIVDATPVTPDLAREGNMMTQIIYLFKSLHAAETPMKNTFKLFELMRHYESLVKDVNTIAMEKLCELKKEMIALQMVYESIPIEQVPCHIDPDYTNIVKNGYDELFLIDWEYSGMFDPLWDIATLCISLELQEEEKHFFLKQYFNRKPSAEELQRLLMHTIFQDYLWGLWAYFKEAHGDDVGDDIVVRFKRAAENIILYKENHEKDII